MSAAAATTAAVAAEAEASALLCNTSSTGGTLPQKKTDTGAGVPGDVVQAAFRGLYLGEMACADAPSRQNICADAVTSIMSKIPKSLHRCHSHKDPEEHVLTVLAQQKGLTLCRAENTFVPYQDIACLSLNPKHTGSSKPKLISLLVRSHVPSMARRQTFVCYVFRLPTVEDNWAFYKTIAALTQQALQFSPPESRLGWM
jgi:hypothetical protein